MGSVSGGIIRRFKHEAFEKFKEWKQLVENQTGRTVKKLRTDNGLEFLIEKKTPMEMCSGHPNDYGMLRTFGCVAYSYVQQDHQLVRDREPRTRTKRLRFRDESNMAAYAFATAEEEDTHEPLTYQEAVAYKDNHQAGQKLVTCKWLFKIKEGIEGVQKPRYKARLVARGFTQRLDVKTAFLHGNLEEVIYMRQPLGYEQDDMLIACKSKAEIGSTKSLLKREFDMKDLREAKKILGMEIVRDQSRKILRVSQSGLDIAYVVSIVSRYLANPGKNHWEAVKWILKYLRGTTNVGLIYGTNRGNHKDVTGFVDSDYAKDLNKGRSITGYAFLVQGCVVSWKATLQYMVALSTTEVEYMALTEAVKEDIWLKNHVFHERTKHINVRYHFIKEVLKAKIVEVLKVGTEHNAADALTKVVSGHKLQHCLELLSFSIG
nr:retrotransposon protein, putative, Ty1-copia subclass [Tanacetum cinerariifolium]